MEQPGKFLQRQFLLDFWNHVSSDLENWAKNQFEKSPSGCEQEVK